MNKPLAIFALLVTHSFSAHASFLGFGTPTPQEVCQQKLNQEYDRLDELESAYEGQYQSVTEGTSLNPKTTSPSAGTSILLGIDVCALGSIATMGVGSPVICTASLLAAGVGEKAAKDARVDELRKQLEQEIDASQLTRIKQIKGHIDATIVQKKNVKIMADFINIKYHPDEAGESNAAYYRIWNLLPSDVTQEQFLGDDSVFKAISTIRTPADFCTNRLPTVEDLTNEILKIKGLPALPAAATQQ